MAQLVVTRELFQKLSRMDNLESAMSIRGIVSSMEQNKSDKADKDAFFLSLFVTHETKDEKFRSSNT